MPSDLPSPSQTIDLASRPAFRLAGLDVEPSVLRLHGPAGSVALEPRMMQLLVALADARDQVVSRDTLLALCWGATVVGDDAIQRAVAGVRRSLRQVGAERVAVETIPKVGYRLTAAAAALGTPSDLGEPSEPGTLMDPAVTTPPLRPAVPASTARRRWLALGTVGVVGAVGAASWTWLRQDPAREAADALVAQGDQALRLAVPRAEEQGVGFFAQAVRAKPDHALAWGRLALARRFVAEYAPPDRLEAARAATDEAIAQALKLDPRQPDALLARALATPPFGAWARLDEELQAVLHIAPGHLPTLDAHAFLLAATGVLAGHYALRLKTVEGDPFHAGYNFRSIYSHWMNGDLAAADRAGERGMELWPQHLATLLARAGLFVCTGRPQRALAVLDDAEQRGAVAPPVVRPLRVVGVALASGTAADRDTARQVLLGGLAHGGPLQAVAAAMSFSAMGETALALDVTEAFLLERGPLMASVSWRPGQTLHNDVRRRMTHFLFVPVTAPLRGHPRFAAIVRDIGLVPYWQRSGRQPDYQAGRPLSG